MFVTFTWLHINKNIVRKQVKRQIIAGIEKEKLVLLKFTKEQTATKLKWKHSKEFEFENQMYDIVETDTVNGMIHFWCWLDSEETQLNKQLKELVSFALGNNTKKQEDQKRLLTFLKLYYFSQDTERIPLFLGTRGNKSFHWRELYRSICNSPPTPPPKIT